MILQILREAGCMRRRAVKDYQKREELNKESSERQRLVSLFFFHLSIVKETKVDFTLFASKAATTP